MAEAVGRRRPGPPLVQQVRRDERLQGLPQRVFGQRGRRLGQGQRKLPADDGAHLGGFSGRAEPVQARPQQVVERGRDGRLGDRRRQLVAPAAQAQPLRLQQHARQLFDEQGHPIRFLEQVRHDRPRQRPAAGEGAHEVFGLGAAEALQMQGAQERRFGPRRRLLRAVRQHEQHRLGSGAGREPAHQIPRRRVGPVQIFDDEEQRPLAGHAHEQPFEDGERARAPLRGAALRPGTGFGRQPQHFGEQPERFVFLEAVAFEHEPQHFGLLGRRLPGVEVEDARQQIRDRVQHRILMQRRAAAEQAGVGLLRRVGGQRADQARLADAGFSGDEHAAAAPSARAPPELF